MAPDALEDHPFYGGSDPRDRPLYSFPQASRATEIPVSTLRAWFVGTTYGSGDGRAFFEPVISRPDPQDARLSFTNVIEAHVLRALRTVHDVRMHLIRDAVTYAQTEFGINRLLISPDLRTSAGRLFLDQYSELLELSASRQLAMRVVLEQYLERVVYDEAKLPRDFFPFERAPRNQGQKYILLSPFISFGRPVIRSSGVTTRAVAQRLDAGEAPELVATDYGIKSEELEEAVLYEAAA